MLIGTVLLFNYIEASVMRMMRVPLAFFVAVFAFFQKNYLGEEIEKWEKHLSLAPEA